MAEWNPSMIPGLIGQDRQGKNAKALGGGVLAAVIIGPRREDHRE